MSNRDTKHEQSLVEQHAMKRLHKVEKEKRRAYVKKPHKFEPTQFFMMIVLLIVLAVMLVTIF